MTALAPKADFDLRSCDVADVPKAVVSSCSKLQSLFDRFVGARSGAGYDHHDYRKEMIDALEAWADHVEQLVTPEGVARGSAFFGGLYRDELVMALLRPEWEARRTR